LFGGQAVKTLDCRPNSLASTKFPTASACEYLQSSQPNYTLKIHVIGQLGRNHNYANV